MNSKEQVEFELRRITRLRVALCEIAKANCRNKDGVAKMIQQIRLVARTALENDALVWLERSDSDPLIQAELTAESLKVSRLLRQSQA